MSKRKVYNPSMTMPVVDILVAIILIVVTGYFWMSTRGEAKLAESQAKLEEARQENIEAIVAEEKKLAAKVEVLAALEIRSEELVQQVEFLKVKKDDEALAIEEAIILNDQYMNEMLDLRTEIQRSKDQRIGYNTDIFETDQRIDEMEANNTDMLTRVSDRNNEVSRLNVWIADAKSVELAEPTSRLPVKSSVASSIDISDPDQKVVFSLSREMRNLKGLDMGLLGSLGLSVDGNSSIKEGGVYANMPLTHRRTSIDFEGGISQLESREENKSSVSPFAGATFRFAPNPKERLFLLAGTRYSHEDLALRFGVSLGRR